MYCFSCGKQIKEGANFCESCGKIINAQHRVSAEFQNTAQTDTQHLPEEKINAFAIAGFAISLVSLFLALGGIVPILGITLSIIGRVQIENTKQRGKGFATAGLIISICALIIVIISMLTCLTLLR